MVDLSGTRQGVTLNQLNKEDRRYLYRFKSRIQLKGEQKYNSGKPNYRVLLYALKKF